MKTIITSDGVPIRIYGTPKECPLKRYNELQKCQIMDSGIGSDMQAISSRFSRLHAFLTAKQNEDATKEAENLFYTHYFILEGINLSAMSLACMVHSIGDKEYNDLSEDGLKETVAALSLTGITQQQIEDAVDEVKKK